MNFRNFLSLIFTIFSFALFSQPTDCYGLLFNGSSSSVTATSPVNDGEDYSIDIRFLSSSTPSGGDCSTTNLRDMRWLFSWENGQYAMGVCNGNLSLIYAPVCPFNNNLCTNLGDIPIEQNRWYHLVVTRANRGLDFYLDGNRVTGIDAGSFNMSGTFFLGRYPSAQGLPWLGMMDEFRMWNKALTKAEIADMANCQLMGSEEGLVTYYNFDRSDASQLVDLSPSGNNGSLNNLGFDNYTNIPVDWCLPCNSQTSFRFDGLDHNLFANTTTVIGKDTICLKPIVPGEEYGTDILLGKARGFAFSFESIDPGRTPHGSYQEWKMIGSQNGVENQLLWTERRQVRHEGSIFGIDVIFDTQPQGTQGNGIRVYRNGNLLYENIVDNGLIYSIEVDSADLPIYDLWWHDVTEVWDATCVAITNFPHDWTLGLTTGEKLSVKGGEDIFIETFGINPTNPAEYCQVVESGNLGSDSTYFHTEGKVMLDERLPFFAVGDVHYADEDNLNLVKINNIGDTDTDGLYVEFKCRPGLPKVEGYDIDWLPVVAGKTKSELMCIYAEGEIDGNEQRLGQVTFAYDEMTEQVNISSNFSDFDTQGKVIQVWRDGRMVKECEGFFESQIAQTDEFPTSCGKLSEDDIGIIGPDGCYRFHWKDRFSFLIQGETFEGDELRILTESTQTIDFLTAAYVLLSNIEDLTVTNVTTKPKTTDPCDTDNEPPMIVCQDVNVRATDLSGAAVDFDQTATDNCSTPILEYSIASGSVFPCGNTRVVALATDAAGNQNECTFEVNVDCNEFRFDGLRHTVIGNSDVNIVVDTLEANINDLSVPSGFDINLGRTLGFGFNFSKINPLKSPNGAYQEWAMVGSVNGSDEQMLWRETRTVNNRGQLLQTDVSFDTSPIGSTGNGIRIYKNGQPVYESIFDNGLLYSMVIDRTLFGSPDDLDDQYVTAVWDNTCVVIHIPEYPIRIQFPNGDGVDVKSGEEIMVETYAVNPSNPPVFCSKVESRSVEMGESKFYDEGIVMFDDRFPFYVVQCEHYGDEFDLATVQITNIGDTGEGGLHIDLDHRPGVAKPESVDIDWAPIPRKTKSELMDIWITAPLDGGDEQRIGKIQQNYNPTTEEVIIDADFSDFTTEGKIVQVWSNGAMIKECKGFFETRIAVTSEFPVGCDKLSGADINIPGVTSCYAFSYQDSLPFLIQGESFIGDELRILTESGQVVDYLSTVDIRLAGMDDFTITNVTVKRKQPDPCATDNEPPTLMCQNISATSTNLTGTDVAFDQLANDNCSTPTIVYTPASGSLLPCGTTRVTAVATDAAGNAADCSFDVTVECSGFNFDGLINHATGGVSIEFDKDAHQLIIPPTDDTGDQGVRIDLGRVRGAGLTMAMLNPKNEEMTIRVGGSLGGQADNDIYSCTHKAVDVGGEKYMSVSFSGNGGGGPGGLNMHWRTTIQNGQASEPTHDSGISNIDVFQYQPVSATEIDWTVYIDLAGWTFINRGDINVIGPDDEKILLPAGSQIMIMPELAADPPEYFDELWWSLANTTEPVNLKKEELILFDDKLVNHSINDTPLKGIQDALTVSGGNNLTGGVTVSWEDYLLKNEKVSSYKMHWTNLQTSPNNQSMTFRPYGKSVGGDLEPLGELVADHENSWTLAASFAGSPPDDSIYVGIIVIDTIPYWIKYPNKPIEVQYPPVGLGWFDEDVNNDGHAGYQVYFDDVTEIEIDGDKYSATRIDIYKDLPTKELKKIEFENAYVTLDIIDEEINTQFESEFYHYGLLHETVNGLIAKNDKEEGNTIVIDTIPWWLTFPITPEPGLDISLGEVLGHSLDLSLPTPGDLEVGESLSLNYIGEADGEPNRQISQLQYKIEEVAGEKRYVVSHTHVPAGTEYTVVMQDADGNELYRGDTGSEELYWLSAPFGNPIDISTQIAVRNGNTHNHSRSNDDDIFFIPPGGGNPMLYPLGGLIIWFAKAQVIDLSYLSKCELRFAGMEGAEIRREEIKFLQVCDDFVEGFAKWDVTEKGQRARVHNLIDQAEDEIHLGFNKAKGFDLEWEPIAAKPDMTFEAAGLYNGAEQPLGEINWTWENQRDRYKITADFSDFDTESKVVQVWDNGNLVQEWTGVMESEIGFVEEFPTVCGKLSGEDVGGGLTACYRFKYKIKWPIRIQGEDWEGDEIRILTESSLPTTGINSLTLRDIRIPDGEITFINTEVTTSSVGGFVQQSDLFDLFPNPAHEELILDFKNKAFRLGEYFIFDQNGILISTADFGFGQTKIDVSNLPNGVYYIRVNSENVFETRRFLKFD